MYLVIEKSLPFVFQRLTPFPLHQFFKARMDGPSRFVQEGGV
jgi:hypothetical protein